MDEFERRSRDAFARMPEREARDELVMMYRSMASNLARRFQNRGEPLDDLIQVANIGLLKAIGRFDPTRGVKFSTYAIPTIIGEIKRHFRDTGWTVRVPRSLQERAKLLRDVIEPLTHELGRSPSVREIAAAANLTEEQVLDAMEAVYAHTPDALEGSGGDDVGPIGSLGGPDERLELLEEWADVAPLLKSLPLRERQLLYYRFVRGLAQGEIAEKLGISQMHVSRLLVRTLQTLRDGVGDV